MMFALDNGVIYQLGRDRHYYPIVVLNLSKLTAVTENKATLTNAMLYLLILVREIMCLPYHVERWNLLIDSSASAYIHGQLEYLAGIEELIRTHFPKSLENVFFFNSTVTSDLGKKFKPFPPGVDSRRRVFVQNKFDQTLNKYIAVEQREKKFGGAIDDLTSDFFPPLATTFVRSGLRAESVQEKKLFYFRMTNHDMFSNIIVQQTSTSPYPLKVREEPRYIERPHFSSSLPSRRHRIRRY